jgi:hypothetical protein
LPARPTERPLVVIFGRRRCKAQQLIAAKIDEIPVAVRMPQRAFGEDEAGGKALGFSGFEHLGQVIGDGHR